ncbi:hypothetical protein [Tateyamaria sp. SN6-1]|uniref:hypothetical protein n=1 Tax=Tateyamaria sp. SN6-1 TaxID=3092148 RepID=UPI0039F5B28A
MLRQNDDADTHSEVEHMVLRRYPDHVPLTEVPGSEFEQRFAEDTRIATGDIGG